MTIHVFFVSLALRSRRLLLLSSLLLLGSLRLGRLFLRRRSRSGFRRRWRTLWRTLGLGPIFLLRRPIVRLRRRRTIFRLRRPVVGLSCGRTVLRLIWPVVRLGRRWPVFRPITRLRCRRTILRLSGSIRLRRRWTVLWLRRPIVWLCCWRPILRLIWPIVRLRRRWPIFGLRWTIVRLRCRRTVLRLIRSIIRLRCRRTVLRLSRPVIRLGCRRAILRLIGLRPVVGSCPRTLVGSGLIAGTICRLISRGARGGLARPRAIVSGLIIGRLIHRMSRRRSGRLRRRRYLHNRARCRCSRRRSHACKFLPRQRLSRMSLHGLLSGSERWRRWRWRLFRNYLTVHYRCGRRCYAICSRGLRAQYSFARGIHRNPCAHRSRSHLFRIHRHCRP